MVPEVLDKFKKTPEDKAAEKEMDKKGEDFLKDKA